MWFGLWDLSFGLWQGDCGTETEPLIALIETDTTDPVPSAPVGWISAIREGFSGISGSISFSRST